MSSLNIFLDPGMLIVLAIRILGPLLIFYWPLLGSILSEFVFDTFDVVIWDIMGTLPKIDYTAFDKPLDMYQLVIQAIVVLVWKQKRPREIALWLFVIRLAGFIIYEITHARVVFLVCPNLFVLFFITYLISVKFCKSEWFNHGRSLAVIFVFLLLLKIPQEYVLHYAEIKPWESIKEKVASEVRR